jgi:hypothetical protein
MAILLLGAPEPNTVEGTTVGAVSAAKTDALCRNPLRVMPVSAAAIVTSLLWTLLL